MNKYQAKIHESKKCQKCFLTPDLCGANCEKECNSIYENKWRMYWEEFKE